MDDLPFGRQRVVTACLPCRRRKVKCDHSQPTCSTCRRGGRECTYANPQATTRNNPLRRTGNGISRQRSSLRNGQDEIRTRLDRLERLLEQALNRGGETSASGSQYDGVRGSQNGGSPGGSIFEPTHTPTQRETISTDGYDGALLLDTGKGQSRWVSSLHYALLADQIHDVKMLLGDQNNHDNPADSPSSDQPSPQFPLAGTTVKDLTPWLPGSEEECFSLLEVFFSNVDPVTRIIHKPSLKHRFAHYVNYIFGSSRSDHRPTGNANTLDTTIQSFEPLAFAIFYAAINSMTPEAVQLAYSADRNTLLAQFQRAVEVSLGREDFLTTSSIEILQAFVLLLTCQSREDNMAKTWSLLGLAIRIALSQGLHREPSLFPSNNMDVVQVELRRRLWHQICYLDFRSAESTGQELTISDDSFTTMLPRNINDADLKEGYTAMPETSSVPGFTDMSGHLIRLHGLHCFRKIAKSTYDLGRRLNSSISLEANTLDPVSEFQAVFTEVRTMVDQMKSHTQEQYLVFCSPDIPEQRLALGLSVIVEWRCWSIFWFRTPKQYRETVVSPEIRQTVLDSSISLIENLHMMTDDKDAKRFMWHIAGHSCFQAIMHIVSELETPNFTAPHFQPLRSRALIALRGTITTRGRETTPTWNAINRIISNCLNRHSPPSLAQTPLPSVYAMPLPALTHREGSGPATVPTFGSLSPALNTDLFSDLEGFEGFGMYNPSLDFDWGLLNLESPDRNLL